MFKGCSRLLGGFTQFTIPLSLELETQQTVDGGWIPGWAQPFKRQGLPEHTHGLVGRSDDSPAEATGLHLLEKTHGEKRLAAASEATEHERDGGIGLMKPVGKGIGGLLLITGESQLGMGGRAHPNA